MGKLWVGTGKCEFCGQERKLLDSTPFHGFYCEECVRMEIDYAKELLGHNQKATKAVTKEQVDELEIQAKEAMAKLMNLHITVD